MKKITSFIKKHKTLSLLIFMSIAYLVLSIIDAQTAKQPDSLLQSQKSRELITSPKNGQKNVAIDAPVIINLSEGLSSAEINISTTPSFIFKPEWQENSVILAHEQYFNSNTTYKITITEIGKDKEIYSFSFTTREIQGNPALLQKIQKETEEKYPLIQKLPYRANGVLINYTDPLSLLVSYDGSQEAKQVAQEWLDQYKNSLSNHQVDWKIITR